MLVDDPNWRVLLEHCARHGAYSGCPLPPQISPLLVAGGASGSGISSNGSGSGSGGSASAGGRLGGQMAGGPATHMMSVGTGSSSSSSSAADGADGDMGDLLARLAELAPFGDDDGKSQHDGQSESGGGGSGGGFGRNDARVEDMEMQWRSMV